MILSRPPNKYDSKDFNSISGQWKIARCPLRFAYLRQKCFIWCTKTNFISQGKDSALNSYDFLRHICVPSYTCKFSSSFLTPFLYIFYFCFICKIRLFSSAFRRHQFFYQRNSSGKDISKTAIRPLTFETYFSCLY